MQQQYETTLPLPLAGEGIQVRLLGFHGSQGHIHRLAELGLSIGSVVTVIRNTGNILLIAAGNSRLALDYAMAHAVLVVPVQQGEHHG